MIYLLYQVYSPSFNIILNPFFFSFLFRAFVLSEGLKKIQEIKAPPGSKLRLYIDEINSIYPQEVVQYYSPDYANTLLRRLDEANE